MVDLTNWTVLVVIGITVCYFIQKMNVKEDKEREKIKKQQEEIRQETLLLKEKEEREREERQEKIKKAREQRIGTLITDSQLLSQDLPERVNFARNALDNAEQEYKDGAFAPFWDAIELAVTSLAHFNAGVRQITQNCSVYQTESQQLDSPPQVFDWKGAADTSDAIAAADRLQKIVRSAQKNFQFAVIYEQRKTNQILVAGFAGLGQALSEIAYRIDESTAALSAAVNDLSFVVSDTSTQIIEAAREDAQAAVKAAAKSTQVIKEQAEAEAETRREHERRELEMLDNIQRGKKPSFPEYRGTLR
ncbi:MAG: hypothetical protein AAB928_01710 [Patescibacteria group bacterium]